MPRKLSSEGKRKALAKKRSKAAPFAAAVIEKLGGVREVARIIGRNPATPIRWMERTGLIPDWHHDRLIAAAFEKGITLTREDFGNAVNEASIEPIQETGS